MKAFFNFYVNGIYDTIEPYANFFTSLSSPLSQAVETPVKCEGNIPLKATVLIILKKGENNGTEDNWLSP